MNSSFEPIDSRKKLIYEKDIGNKNLTFLLVYCFIILNLKAYLYFLSNLISIIRQRRQQFQSVINRLVQNGCMVFVR